MVLLGLSSVSAHNHEHKHHEFEHQHKHNDEHKYNFVFAPLSQFLLWLDIGLSAVVLWRLC